MPSRSSGGERLRSVTTQRFVHPEGAADDLEPGSLAGVHGASVAGPPVHEATRGAATAVPEDVRVSPVTERITRMFEPAVLPTEGTIIVRGLNRQQVDLWIREQPKLLPGQRRFIYAGLPQNFDDATPAAVVLLPGWYRHRYCVAIDGMIERLALKAGGSVPLIHVFERC